MGDDDDNRRGGGRMYDRALTSSERRRRDGRRGTNPTGVQVLSDPGDEVTALERILGREPTEFELELLRRLDIRPEAPVRMGDLAKLLLREESGNKQMGAQLDEFRQLLNQQTSAAADALRAEMRPLLDDVEKAIVASKATADEQVKQRAELTVLTKDADALRVHVRWARWLGGLAIAAAAGSAGWVGRAILERSRQEVESAVRAEGMRHDLDQIQTYIYRGRDGHQP